MEGSLDMALDRMGVLHRLVRLVVQSRLASQTRVRTAHGLRFPWYIGPRYTNMKVYSSRYTNLSNLELFYTVGSLKNRQRLFPDTAPFSLALVTRSPWAPRD